jgi:hypothetical protein
MRRLSVLPSAVLLVFLIAPWSTSGPPQVHAADPAAVFSYTSVWYPNIYIGDTQHIQLQARDHVKQGIWVIIHFASSLQYAYYESTDSNGFWSKEFAVPADSVGPHSAEAVVTLQLWYGDTTAKDFQKFSPLVPPATYDSIVSTISNFSVAVGKGDDAKARSYLTGAALSEANATSVLQTLGLPGRPSTYLYHIQSYTDLEASAKMTYYVSGVPHYDQFKVVHSGGWKIGEITPLT